LTSCDGRTLGTVLLALVVPVQASAGLISPPFASRVEMAGAIFAGTVSEVIPEHLDGTIVTRVHFRDVRYAKGSPLPGGVTRLTLLGGTVGDRIVVASKSVEFVAGRRYVVLSTADLGSRLNSWLPVIGSGGGLFHVEVDPTRMENVVSTYRGLPIAGVTNGGLEITGTSLMERNYGQRMTENDFLSALRDMDRSKK
jgi:hypothetical protein